MTKSYKVNILIMIGFVIIMIYVIIMSKCASYTRYSRSKKKKKKKKKPMAEKETMNTFFFYFELFVTPRNCLASEELKYKLILILIRFYYIITLIVFPLL